MDTLSHREGTDIQEITVNGFSKRGEHNVFEITVSKTNGVDSQIIRRYSDLASFHRALTVVYSGRDDIDLPSLPTFRQLFYSVSEDHSHNSLVPNLDCLSKYLMMLLATLNSPLVENFFALSDFDAHFRRKPFCRTNKVEENETFHNNNSLPQFLVIADYNDGHVKILAGDLVYVIGRDSSEWFMVLYNTAGDNESKKYGWLPNAHLIWKEPGDPLVEDIQSYLLEQRHSSSIDDNSAFTDPLVSSASDLLAAGCYYTKYTLTIDYTLYTIDGINVSLRKGKRVRVIDKDTYGWWYVSCSKGDGWLPSTVLDHQPQYTAITTSSTFIDTDTVHIPPDQHDPLTYYVTKDYIACQSDELCFPAGEEVHVVYQSNSGWWTVKSVDQSFVGLFPAVYLSKKKPSKNSFEVTRHYNIGYNSTMAKSPPPRSVMINKNEEESEILSPSLFSENISPFSSTDPSPISPNPDHASLSKDESIQAEHYNEPHPPSSERRVSLSAPNSPISEKFSQKNLANTKKTQQGQSSDSPARKRFLVPSRKISEGQLHYERPKSPIPLRFYRKNSSKDRPLIEEWAEPTSPEKTFFDKVSSRLVDSPNLNRSFSREGKEKERGEEKERLINEREENQLSDHERREERGEGEREKDYERIKIKLEHTEEENSMVKRSNENRLHTLINEQETTDNEQQKLKLQQLEEEITESEEEAIPPISTRRRLSSLKKFPRLGNVKFSPDVKNTNVDDEIEDQRKGASFKRLGPQNSFFQKQKTFITVTDSDDLCDETVNGEGEEVKEEEKEEVKEEEEEEEEELGESDHLFSKFLNKQGTTAGLGWQKRHVLSEEKEEEEEEIEEKEDIGVGRRNSLLSKQTSFGGFKGESVEFDNEIMSTDLSHSPIPDSHSPVPDEHSPIPQSYSAVPQSHNPIPQSHSPIPDRHSPIPQSHSPIPDRYSPIPQSHSPMPDRHSPVPQSHSPILDRHSPIPQSHSPIPQSHSPILDRHSPIPQSHSPILDRHSPIPQSHSPILDRHSPILNSPIQEVPDIADSIHHVSCNNAWTNSSSTDDNDELCDANFSIDSVAPTNTTANTTVIISTASTDDDVSLDDVIDTVVSSAPPPPPSPPPSSLPPSSPPPPPSSEGTLASHFPVGYSLSFTNNESILSQSSVNHTPSVRHSLTLTLNAGHTPYDHTPRRAHSQSPLSFNDHDPLLPSNHYHDNQRPSSATSMLLSNRYHDNQSDSTASLPGKNYHDNPPKSTPLSNHYHDNQRRRSLSPTDVSLQGIIQSDNFQLNKKDDNDRLVSSGFLNLYHKTNHKLLHEKQHQ